MLKSHCSELRELGHVLGSGRREEIGGELRGLAHVTSDLHLALHESDLRVELTKADILEISVRHGEGGISIGGLSSLALALTTLEVNLVDEGRLGTFLGRDVEGEDGIDLGDEVLAVTCIKVSRHHVEDALRFEARASCSSGNRLRSSGCSFLDLLSLDVGHDSRHELLISGRVLSTSLILVDLRPLIADLLWGESVDVELDTSRLLPALLGNKASTDLVEATILITAIACEPGDERRDEIWFERVEDLCGHDSRGHTGASKRGDAVSADIALGTLLGE